MRPQSVSVWPARGGGIPTDGLAATAGGAVVSLEADIFTDAAEPVPG